MAQALGIGESNLGNWVRQTRVDRGEREGLTKTERAELAQLCHKVTQPPWRVICSNIPTTRNTGYTNAHPGSLDHAPHRPAASSVVAVVVDPLLLFAQI